MADGGKRSADNLLNGARSFKSQYLSRGGEDMEGVGEGDRGGVGEVAGAGV